MTERQPAEGKREKDRPWLMRTYAGHSTAEASNSLNPGMLSSPPRLKS